MTGDGVNGNPLTVLYGAPNILQALKTYSPENQQSPV